METWALIWKLTFIVVMTVFAGMLAWVIIGGWRDIRTLLKKLKEQDPDSDSAGQSGNAED